MTIGRKTLTAVGALAVALATAPAFAADMPQASDPVFTQAPTQAAYIWSGPYAGFHLGYGWGDSDTAQGGGVVGHDVEGFIGGIQGGYNFQSNNFVYGFEGDISYSDADGSTGLFFGAPVNVDQNWLATLRARAGVAFGPSLLYVTGGAAFADVDVNQAGFGDSNIHAGWTLGGGWEYAINERLSMKAEYLYADFGDETYNLGGVPTNVDLDQHIARIGVNWRFGGAAY